MLWMVSFLSFHGGLFVSVASALHGMETIPVEKKRAPFIWLYLASRPGAGSYGPEPESHFRHFGWFPKGLQKYGIPTLLAKNERQIPNSQQKIWTPCLLQHVRKSRGVTYTMAGSKARIIPSANICPRGLPMPNSHICFFVQPFGLVFLRVPVWVALNGKLQESQLLVWRLPAVLRPTHLVS